jgi:hypothetical protein
MEEQTMTFEQFQQGMIAYAKEVQGDGYPGDDYYLDPCWKEYWEDGDSPSDAVILDMGYWE